MYKLRIESGFRAEHYVRMPNGRWEAPNSHNWLVRVVLAAAQLDSYCMVADFSVIKGALDRIIASLESQTLNNLPQFQDQIPTAEVVARYIYDQLSAELADLPAKLEAVKVQEAPGMWAVYQAAR